MRMWMIDPKFLCQKHLIGEHGELHKHRHNFIKQHNIAGRYGQIEPKAMKQRHDELVKEMLRRGYNHQSPYKQPDISYLSTKDYNGKVNKKESLKELVSRCKYCRKRINNI